MTHPWLAVLFCLLLLFTGRASSEKCQVISEQGEVRPLHVVYFVPKAPPDTFWYRHKQFTQAAAKSLNIKLTTLEIGRVTNGAAVFTQELEKTLNQDNKPDMALGLFYMIPKSAIVDTFEQHRLPYFSLNTSFGERLRQIFGKPREQYQYWIGHLMPDDEAASYHMTRRILANKPQQTSTSMIAIAGAIKSTVSLNRVKGLKKAVDENKVSLYPVAHTNWSQQDASRVLRQRLQRANSAHAMWLAGNEITLGAISVLQDLQFKPGQITLGTFDWTQQTMDLIKTGWIDVAYGGHFIEGGVALALMLDYAQGIDFAEETDTMITMPLQPLTKNNLHQDAKLIDKSYWGQINFKHLSKCYSPKRSHYQLTIDDTAWLD
ncbi:hypothetical protein C2869_05070 [Saccharobesus litoralis]|uniref:Periplasmic binding protein domain-containing protein n=1 Tax=Saccharobesus litoralis TaxID=2172099 RepID=A0A2S0VNP9_9ALTE|nr:substrate-binding domain-containing protein [Saccharobesus litoralis]AWB65848.1 hypothetical protein C2869_05070 [Saccharobesus litoralis]